MESADEDRVFLSVSLWRYGVERMPTGARRTRLEHWLGDELPLRFEGRIFAVDESVAEAWGKMVSRSEALGRPMDVMDALLSATAEVLRLTLVTRNVSDFPALKTIVNP